MTHTDSVASAEPAGVAGDVAIRRFGGPAAAARATDDARTHVTIEVPEFAPWRVRVEFLVFVDPELSEPEYEYIPCGCALERPISMAEANDNPDAVADAFPKVWSLFAKLAAKYWYQAELVLRFQRSELADVRRDLVAGRAHKHHALLVADYRSRPAARGSGRIDDMAEGRHRHDRARRKRAG